MPSDLPKQVRGSWRLNGKPTRAAQFAARLTGQLGEPGLVVPGGLADELLQGLARLVVEVGDGLDVLVLQSGEQAGDVVAGVQPLVAALQQRQEGGEEAFQAGEDAAGDAGIDLGIGQELATAGSIAAVHRQLLLRTPFSERAFHETTWPRLSTAHSRSIKSPRFSSPGHP
jgi:hypothetical protein